MRKQTKLLAVLSASALLAIGASMTSFAATGWVDEDGSWVYYDSDGDMVTDEWRKSGNNWYYLDEDGYMATESWVDSDYYVGEEGTMLKNAWVKASDDEDAESDDPSENDEHWYYFKSTGKKATEDDGWMKINEQYYRFDSDGRMLDGWQEINNEVYYLGEEDDGARKTGWLYLNLNLDNDDDEHFKHTEDISEDDDGWFWFSTNGKSYRGSEKKKINGKNYYFDENGMMLSGWVYVGSDSNVRDDVDLYEQSVTIDDYVYCGTEDDGARKSGWVKLNGPEGLKRDSETKWYYFDGAPYNSLASANKTFYKGSDRTAASAAIYNKKISGKTYAFDYRGEMKSGLLPVYNDNGDLVASYYFGVSADGAMKTGKVSGVEEDDGSKYTYFFTESGSNKGKGITGEKDDYLYYLGKRQESDDDYRIVVVPTDLMSSTASSSDADVAYKAYIVNTSGKIQDKAGKKYEVDNYSTEVTIYNGQIYAYDKDEAHKISGEAIVDMNNATADDYARFAPEEPDWP